MDYDEMKYLNRMKYQRKMRYRKDEMTQEKLQELFYEDKAFIVDEIPDEATLWEIHTGQQYVEVYGTDFVITREEDIEDKENSCFPLRKKWVKKEEEETYTEEEKRIMREDAEQANMEEIEFYSDEESKEIYEEEEQERIYTEEE